MIRVVLPYHLRVLAQIPGEIQLDVRPPVTQKTVFDALEHRYPMLAGTVRDRDTQRRRAYLRVYGCQLDLSHEEPDSPLPDAVAAGHEPLLVIGAISGG
jgi:sulfur-carrier protein